MKIIDYPLKHYNERKDGKSAKYIMMHYTDMLSLQDTIDILNKREVSSHYCVDEDGTVLKFVDEDKRAWHAGRSYWYGETDMNSVSIGIEIQNHGHTNGYKPFPEKQIAAVIELTLEIMKRHNIPAKNIIGHSDVAPDRKPDPGHFFPWEELANKHGIGVWAKNVTKEHIEHAENIIGNLSKIEKLFVDIGYAPVGVFGENTPTLKDIIIAFQRHYEPELFLDSDKKDGIGKPLLETIALAVCLRNQLSI